MLVCLLLVLHAGCAKEYAEEPGVREFIKKDADAAGAIDAVRGYNQALRLTYAANDTALLVNFATDRELNKVRHLIEGFSSQRLVLQTDLKRMRIEKIERRGPNNVVVTTVEKWTYRRFYADTKKEQQPLTDIEYHLRYNMTREDGVTWKVFDLSPV